jgi:hypothetical protein
MNYEVHFVVLRFSNDFFLHLFSVLHIESICYFSRHNLISGHSADNRSTKQMRNSPIFVINLVQ